MTVPAIVSERLGGEDPKARVPLGGDDELIVTPTRSLVYRAEGLLSDESVEEYGHEAEAVRVSEGRRKSTIRLDYGIDGDSELTVPSNRLEDVLPVVLEGVLASGEVTDGDESVREVYRLGELTIVITDARVIKHIGNAVWDLDAEVFEFEQVTDIDTEEGEVSSQIIVEVDRRPERIKTPTDDARKIREQIERALLAYHDVNSYGEFRDLVQPDDDDDEGEEGTGIEITGELDMGEASGAEAESQEETPTIDFGGTTQDATVAEEVAALRVAIERQSELLEEHQQTIEQLIEELRRGR